MEAHRFDAVAAIDPQENACIAGTGLSMVDAVLTHARRRMPARFTSFRGMD